MKILIFTEGTIIMHKNAAGRSREEIVKPKEIGQIKNVLKIHKFPEGDLVFRKKGEEYKDVAERIVPDILIDRMIWKNY